ncbi:hypothetical protein BaRGS_00032761 [Batillaria attramentaria]|uniref:Carbohydrate sulfotransferase n=1 Tax=Batillaria attramentaria TaxID=370345 RepID=A0ABD0JME5_9CAEN
MLSEDIEERSWCIETDVIMTWLPCMTCRRRLTQLRTSGSRRRRRLPWMMVTATLVFLIFSYTGVFETNRTKIKYVPRQHRPEISAIHHHHPNYSLTPEELLRELGSTLAASSVPSVSTEPDWADVQKARVDLMKEHCKRHIFSARKPTYGIGSILDKNRKLLYCPVEKVASTFMRRFMYSLVHNPHSKTVTYPFHVPIDVALKYKYDTTKTIHFRDYNKALNTKFLFVREPYSRLFSAFVDKLLVPNDVYWKWWAVPAVSKFRKSASAKSKRCGNDVTFSEFVKHVISRLHRTDPHVKSVKALCAPCEMNYTVIGHSETFSRDFRYLVDVLNISFEGNSSFQNLSIDVAKDAIMDSTNGAFSHYKKLQTCLTKFEMGQRLWTKMQIRGVISNDLEFPLSEQEMDEATVRSFMLLLDKAYAQSDNGTQLREQKTRALSEAFETVPVEDIRKLTEIYSLDFEMFGYDKYPDFIASILERDKTAQ